MSVLTDLQDAKENIAGLIKEITSSANPDYTVGNRSISKGAYLGQLMEQLAAIDTAIIRASGPFEIRSRGIV